MKELLGFAILGWPIIGLLIYIALATLAGIAVYAMFRGGKWRWLKGIAIAIAAVAVLFGDEMVGRAYLENLCEAEHGVKVIKTVDLSPKYWDENGKPRFVSQYGDIDMKVLGDRIVWRRISEPVLTFGAHVEKLTSRLVDKRNSEVLAESTNYSRRYGLLRIATSLAPNVGESCADVTIRRTSREEWSQRNRQDAAKLEAVFVRSTKE